MAKALKAAVLPPSEDSPHKAAFFLMIPGAAEVYATYLQRLAESGP